MNSSRYFKLGLFVLIGVALLVGTIVTLGAGSLFAKTVLAETYVDESVAGLEAGSAVKYRGVTVGRVKDIRFAASKYAAAAEAGQFSRKILIEMSLNADVVSEFGEAAIAKMVQEGLRARITQTGITGAAYVGLDFYDPKAYPPAAINWKPEGVYIPAIPSITSEVMTTVERLMTDFTQADLPGVLKRFDTLLEDVNKSVDELKLSEVREQVVALLTEVRGTNSRIKQLLDDPKLQTAVHDLPDITSRLQASVARADEILHDKRLDQTLTGLSDAATNAGPAAADARRLMRDTRTLVASQEDDLRTIITDLRSAVANLNTVTEDAKANPSRLLLGQPPPRKKPGE
jgi:ABC-type transporter Mla subunit MlaD